MSDLVRPMPALETLQARLTFPWGTEACPPYSPRVRGYLTWLQRQSPRRKVHYLRKLTGEISHFHKREHLNCL